MSLLSQCAPSRWFDFLRIPDHYCSSARDRDFFVGKSTKATLILDPERETQFRDLVVLGNLTIESSDLEKYERVHKIAARNFFSAGNITVRVSLKVVCEGNIYIAKRDEFQKELQDLIFEWLGYQRESRNEIGLSSLLI